MNRKNKNSIQSKNAILRTFSLFIIFCFLFSQANAQEKEVLATIDSTQILIGQQINYKVEVLANEGEPVVFPEGQTFSPLEMIESYAVDTASSASAKVRLIKKYGLTQFDSGSYKIPRQKILIGTRTVETDSFRVEVRNVILDTVNQGLYDIKPVIELPKDYSNWWKYLLWILPVALAIGAFLWWLLRRNKKQKEAEKYVPPFEKALATLHELDSKDFIANAKYKEYYSVLTDAVRRYYDEKVYDRAMESTTDELLERLEMERESGHIPFSTQTIAKLKDIFKRADLIKFARVNPPEGKAHADRLVVEEIVKETKEALPAPTVEELMKQEDYRETLSRKRKRKLWLTGIGGVLAILLIATGIGIAVKGYDEVRDFILGNATRELAEGTWITSEYGSPSMVVSTPKVLVRQDVPLPPEAQGKMEATAFAWATVPPNVSVAVYQFKFPQGTEVQLEQLINSQLAEFEAQGFTADLVKNEKYKTPNGAEGLKTFGTGTLKNEKKGVEISGEYAMLTFQAENIVQQLFISWQEEDEYSKQIAERVLQSVELQAPKQEK
ncbi:hypothetical protein EAX61_02825 [Dokdonia sinensis]|uniref:DUF4381 domain-containing protein n=1 Tax=Dokdonia sinensis TaxID=2479847 RepID=A0A3M0GNU7_9FLAO|nr:hypothetical protein [Dokdonia sinensis]RMB63343.1 hypothetical protein EAX61_02825 [Dokdonia sinensis]